MKKLMAVLLLILMTQLLLAGAAPFPSHAEDLEFYSLASYSEEELEALSEAFHFTEFSSCIRPC